MKRVFSIVAKVLIVGLCLWVLVSWCDVMADNSKPNPQHSKFNFFNVLYPNVRVEDCRVEAINHKDNTIELVDVNDDVWIAEVDNTVNYHIDQIVTVKFKEVIPTDRTKDEIIELKV